MECIDLLSGEGSVFSYFDHDRCIGHDWGITGMGIDDVCVPLVDIFYKSRVLSNRTAKVLKGVDLLKIPVKILCELKSSLLEFK